MGILAAVRKFLGPFTPKSMYRTWVFYIVNHWLSYPGGFKIKRVLLNSLHNIDLGVGVKVVGPIKITVNRLQIGKNTWVGKNFMCNGNGTVTIGCNCDIAPEVIFNTGGHEIGTPERRGGEGVVFHQNIGNGCWIGARSTFINNCSVGDSSVVASCACVGKQFQPNVIVGGVPAKVIKELH